VAARADDGFSLVEALVALLVLSVATVGIVRATEQHITVIGGLQDRAAAQWVAENRLVELGLSGAPERGTSEEMLGRRWRVATTTRPTEDPDLLQVQIAVRAEGAQRPAATFGGFLDRGAAGPRP